MRLDLDRTPTGRSDLPVDGSVAVDLGSGETGQAQVLGSLRVDNLESRFVLRGKLAATVPAVCDRCLKDFELAYTVPVELVVLRDTEPQDDDGDTPVLHRRTGVVELDEVLREAALLALPLARICRDDCRGLCARCGSDLNDATCDCVDDEIDPRWEGLPG
jgi:uncharacterized protein